MSLRTQQAAHISRLSKRNKIFTRRQGTTVRSAEGLHFAFAVTPLPRADESDGGEQDV